MRETLRILIGGVSRCASVLVVRMADEGAAYADRLRRASVPVQLRGVTGVTHGFIRLHNLFDVADQELSTISSNIRKAVTRDDKI